MGCGVKPRDVITVNRVTKLYKSDAGTGIIGRGVEKKVPAVIAANRCNQRNLRLGVIHENIACVGYETNVACEIGAADAQGISAIQKLRSFKRRTPHSRHAFIPVKPCNQSLAFFGIAKLNRFNLTDAAVGRSVEVQIATVITVIRKIQLNVRWDIVYYQLNDIQRRFTVTGAVSAADAYDIRTVVKSGSIEGGVPVIGCVSGAVKPRNVFFAGTPVAKFDKSYAAQAIRRRCVENKIAAEIACARGKQGNRW